MFLGGKEFLGNIYHEEKSYKYGYIKMKIFGTSKDITSKIWKDKIQNSRNICTCITYKVFVSQTHKMVYKLKEKDSNPIKKWEKI